MKILDLCCGLGGATRAFKDRGHEVFTVDIEPKYHPTLCKDIRDVWPNELPDADFIWASPPCNFFSVASVPHYMNVDCPDLNCETCFFVGRTNKKKFPAPEQVEGIEIAMACKLLIRSKNPRFWVIENPTAMMRHILGLPTVTTFFASWEDNTHKKPTDLWGKLPPMTWPQPKNWIPSPRGSKHPDTEITIPYGLSLALCIAIENEMSGQKPPLTLEGFAQTMTEV